MPLAAALITPELTRVGSYIRTLTREGGGGEAGTFTDKTRPSGAEALIFAQRAARHLALQLGNPDTDWTATANQELLDSAKDAAAVYAALQIATSFYDDGSNTIAPLIDQLGRMAREQITALVAAARSNNTGGWHIRSIQQTTPEAEAAAALALLPHQIANGPNGGGGI